MTGEYVPDEPARNDMLGENTPDREGESCSKCDGWGCLFGSDWAKPAECDRCNGTGEEPTE